MKTFTVFCREITGEGTIWISSVEAESVDDAKEIGREECAGDWCYDPEDVHVLGVAEGDVNIIYWDD